MQKENHSERIRFQLRIDHIVFFLITWCKSKLRIVEKYVGNVVSRV